jgi:anti-sigma B factor antagonist
MFEIQVAQGGQVKLSGRLDAAEADRAQKVLRTLDGPVTFDCSELDYISSAGIGVLIETYKRLHSAGHPLRFVQMLPRVRSIFKYAGLDRVLNIE